MVHIISTKGKNTNTTATTERGETIGSCLRSTMGDGAT